MLSTERKVIPPKYIKAKDENTYVCDTKYICQNVNNRSSYDKALLKTYYQQYNTPTNINDINKSTMTSTTCPSTTSASTLTVPIFNTDLSENYPVRDYIPTNPYSYRSLKNYN